jgi:hypothetical protein
VNKLAAFLKNPAVVHDVALYLGTFATLYGADVAGIGPGATWGAVLAAVPAAVSATVRELLVVHQTNVAQAKYEADLAKAPVAAQQATGNIGGN